MADTTYSNLLRGSASGKHVAGDPATFKVTAIIDLTPNAKDKNHLLINDGNGVAGGANHDIIQAIQVPANTIVERVFWEVLEAASSTFTANIGDDGDEDGWDAGIDMETVGVTLGDGDYNNDNVLGKLYATANTIDLIPVTDATHTSGIISITAIMTPLTP